MVQVLIFVSGAIVGFGLCKLTEVFKDKQDSRETIMPTTFSPSGINGNTAIPINRPEISDLVDISPLASMMSRYGVDPSSGNSVYLLYNKIKTYTFKKLLDDIVEKTSNGEEFISFLDKANIDTFVFPKASDNTGKYYVSIASIDNLINELGIKDCQLDAYGKIETLINIAYASAIERIKKNFGGEISKLIKAHESQADLTSYYNDLIKEVQVSREFLRS